MEMMIGIIAMILWDAFKEPFLKWARHKAKAWWRSMKNSKDIKLEKLEFNY